MEDLVQVILVLLIWVSVFGGGRQYFIHYDQEWLA